LGILAGRPDLKKLFEMYFHHSIRDSKKQYRNTPQNFPSLKSSNLVSIEKEAVALIKVKNIPDI